MRRFLLSDEDAYEDGVRNLEIEFLIWMMIDYGRE